MRTSLLAESDFQKSVIARRQQRQTDGIEGWFATPEDLILLKLMAERTRDQADVADVFFVNGQLDIDYMRRWAGELDVLEAFDRAIREANR